MLYHCLLALFAHISLAVAADPQLVFTSTPLTVVAGNSYNLSWSGGDGVSPVTIELRRGNSADLTWVAFLTTDATDNFFRWTVSPDLPDASDYALQIFEMANVNNINYSARFSLSGGFLAPTPTTNQAVGTGAGTGSSMETGSALPRSTTFVAATLTSLNAACSGQYGTCASPATPSATGGGTSAGPSRLLSSSTPKAIGQAGRLAACPEHVLILGFVLVLVSL